MRTNFEPLSVMLILSAVIQNLLEKPTFPLFDVKIVHIFCKIPDISFLNKLIAVPENLYVLN